MSGDSQQQQQPEDEVALLGKRKACEPDTPVFEILSNADDVLKTNNIQSSMSCSPREGEETNSHDLPTTSSSGHLDPSRCYCLDCRGSAPALVAVIPEPPSQTATLQARLLQNVDRSPIAHHHHHYHQFRGVPDVSSGSERHLLIPHSEIDKVITYVLWRKTWFDRKYTDRCINKCPNTHTVDDVDPLYPVSQNSRTKVSSNSYENSEDDRYIKINDLYTMTWRSSLMVNGTTMSLIGLEEFTDTLNMLYINMMVDMTVMERNVVCTCTPVAYSARFVRISDDAARAIDYFFRVNIGLTDSLVVTGSGTNELGTSFLDDTDIIKTRFKKFNSNLICPMSISQIKGNIDRRRKAYMQKYADKIYQKTGTHAADAGASADANGVRLLPRPPPVMPSSYTKNVISEVRLNHGHYVNQVLNHGKCFVNVSFPRTILMLHTWWILGVGNDPLTDYTSIIHTAKCHNSHTLSTPPPPPPLHQQYHNTVCSYDGTILVSEDVNGQSG